MKLLQGWYAVLSSDELSKNKPLGLKLFAENLVFWRDAQGAAQAMSDWCPHRAAKLSGGSIVNSKIVCPYHGFEFDSTGSCQFVPETAQAAPNLKVKTYQIKEQHGFIWLWQGESSPTASPTWFKELDQTFSYSTFSETWPVHYSRAVENQLDSAHLPFVHKNTIGQGSNPQSERVFELKDDSIKVLMGGDNDKAFLELRFPNIWQLAIAGKFRIVAAFVPIDEEHTKIYIRSYQKFVTLPILKDLVNALLITSNKKILKQDYNIVTSQKPLGELNWPEEKLFPSDRAIAFYRKKLSEI